MYNSKACSDIEQLLDKYYVREINELRYNVARYAINAKIRGVSISDICKEILNISYESLKQQGKNEERFLEPIIDLIKQNKVPADM